jgi:hypothetical protein
MSLRSSPVNRHRLRIDTGRFSVKFAGEEREDIRGDLAFFRLARAGPIRPEADEGEQGRLLSGANQTVAFLPSTSSRI